MKKVLAIMGSPRKNKNTDKLLDAFLKTINQELYTIEKVYLNELDIKHCTGCEFCNKTGNCSKKDDMSELYEKIDSSQVIIVAAPVYFNSLNGLTKNMIDRCQRYWALKYELGQEYKRNEDRIGILLSVGGAPFTYDQFDGSIAVMDFFFRAVNAKYKGNVFMSHTDKTSVESRNDLEDLFKEMGTDIENKKDFYLHR